MLADGERSIREAAPGAGRPSAAELAVPAGCPFLVAESGGWRLDVPSRDHRCAAFSPPASLSPEKQSRLCLTAAHTSCATYLASLAARESRLGGVPVDRATRWGLARTTTVIEDSGGVRGRVMTLVLDRRRWPAIPAVLLVTTLFALALSGFRGGIPATPVATASPLPPSPGATGPRPTPRPTAATTQPAGSPTDAPTSVPTAPPSAPPPTGPLTQTAAPADTAEPSASFRTYRVQSGDTLFAIAARFGTTVGAIAQLNGIEDPGSLRVGQVLLIP